MPRPSVLRASEGLSYRIVEDTGYTTVCPFCCATSGNGNIGPRLLNLRSCEPCAARSKEVAKKVRSKRAKQNSLYPSSSKKAKARPTRPAISSGPVSVS